MTRNEIIFSIVFCVVVGVVLGLVVVLTDLGEGGVLAVVSAGGVFGGLLAGQMEVRVTRRERGRAR